MKKIISLIFVCVLIALGLLSFLSSVNQFNQVTALRTNIAQQLEAIAKGPSLSITTSDNKDEGKLELNLPDVLLSAHFGSGTNDGVIFKNNSATKEQLQKKDDYLKQLEWKLNSIIAFEAIALLLLGVVFCKLVASYYDQITTKH